MPEDPQIFVYTRTDELTEMLVYANFYDKEADCHVLSDWADAQCLIANEDRAPKRTALHAYEAGILVRKR